MKEVVSKWIKKKELQRYWKQVEEINNLQKNISDLRDVELQNDFLIFRQNLVNENDKLIVFAYVKEAIDRIFHIQLHDVQVLAGLVLTDGKIAEMATGEGKTLMSVLPTVWFALKRKGVHVMTVNTYLAKRDFSEMRKVFEFLGLSVGLNIPGMNIEQKKVAYQKDITYGICSEFGFDFLRDQLVYDPTKQVQTPLSYVIVDEIDSLLIDEAKTPLIIANYSKEPIDMYHICAQFIKRLKENQDYDYDRELQQVMFTEEGIRKIEKAFLIDNLYDLDNVSIYHYLLQSLRAKVLMQRDVHYIISNQKVELIDPFTGRILEGRQLNDGLHQAIEAKENVPLSAENKPHAMVTLQKFFKLYEQAVGMSGTILTEEEELYEIYGLDGVKIPTNKPLLRQDEPSRVFLTKEAKLKAISAEVQASYEKGQPVLIGTTSISSSEEMATYLQNANIPYQLLNAIREEEEAEIISRAGQKGAVTIATNMAGRGTDIRLGEGVAELGGLYVIGSEHHESRRIDNQLRGRAGRQGDIGKSCFFVSLEDDLVQRFARDKAEKFKNKWNENVDEGLKDQELQHFFNNVQMYVEKQSFEIRSIVNALDSVVHDQRRTFYSHRKDALHRKSIEVILQETIATYFNRYIQHSNINFDEGISPFELMKELGLPVLKINTNIDSLKNQNQLKDFLLEQWTHLWEEIVHVSNLQEQNLRQMYLKIIDEAWVHQLEVLQHLKEGIHYRAFEQRNLLLIYNEDAWELYRKMEMAIQNRVFTATLEMIREIKQFQVKTG